MSGARSSAVLTRRARAFTVAEFTVAMILTLVVLLASAVALERGMRSLADGKARDGAAEVAYQVLAKQRVFGCGLGVGGPSLGEAAFPEDRIEGLCATLFGTRSATDPATAPGTTTPLRCAGDIEDTRSADYQPGSCFQMDTRDPEHVPYRVYVRTVWRGGDVPANGCWVTERNASATIGQPAVLQREVVVRYERNGRWSLPARPAPADAVASRSTDASVVVTGGNMIPDGVPFVTHATASVAGQLTTGASELVDLTVTDPTTGASRTLTRWSDDRGCVWFPFLPADHTVSSQRLGIATGTQLAAADGTPLQKGYQR